MRRYRRDYRRHVIGLIIVVAVVLARVWMSPGKQGAPKNLTEGVHQVRRVVDGDTLLLASGARVRLQGIDTPETVRNDHPVERWGPEAKAFTEQFVQSAGNRVRLTFGRERLDRYDRFLAFVWHDEVMLNEELVRQGLARARLDYRYSGTMKARLKKAQQEARQAKRGIWSGP